MSDHAPSPGCCLEHDLEFREYQVTKLRAQVASLTAQRDALRDALAQAEGKEGTGQPSDEGGEAWAACPVCGGKGTR